MHPSNVPVVKAEGRTFVAVDSDDEFGCGDCVAAQPGADKLCSALPECSGRTFNIIFKEIH